MSDYISRQAVNTLVDELARAISDERCFMSRGRSTGEIMSDILNLPSVENKGEWIYDMSIYNWRCSRCGQTLPPTGYVGTAEFMTKHFKFCNHCGASMKRR